MNPSADPADSPVAPPPPTKWRRRSLILLWSLLALSLSAVLATGFAYHTLVRTPTGLALLIRLVNRFAPVQLACTDLSGALYGGMSCGRLTLVAASLRVEFDGLHAELSPMQLWPLTSPTLHFERISAERLTVLTAVRPTRDPPPSIAPPLPIDIGQVQLGQYQWWTNVAAAAVMAPIDATAHSGDGLGQATVTLQDLSGMLAITPAQYNLSQGRLTFAGNPITLTGTLASARPFAVQAEGTVQSRLIDHPVQAAWTATNTLVDVQVQAQVSGGAAQGQVRLNWASFAVQPLQTLQADLTGIDPAAWWAGAPQASLTIKSDLKLRNASSVARLGGPLRIDNAAPGPLDQKRVPVRSLTAELLLPPSPPAPPTPGLPAAPPTSPSTSTARTDTSANAPGAIELRGLEARLVTGLVRGALQSGASAAAGWDAALALEGVDLATLHTALRPLVVDGSVRAKQRDGQQQVEAELSSRATGKLPPTQLATMVLIDPDRVEVREAHLRLGSGSADGSGSWDRRTSQLRGAGQLQAVDLGVLLTAVQTRLNGSFDFDGSVVPQPAGSLRVKLSDSQICLPPAPCQPLAGQAAVALNTERRLQVDADFDLRDNRLRAHGSLDEQPVSEASLQVGLDVPSLQTLLPSMTGALTANATLGGSWRAPSMQARLVGKAVRSGVRGAGNVKAEIDYSGGADGELRASLALETVQWNENPTTVLRTALVELEGRPQAHRVSMHAVTVLDKRLTASGQGGWRSDGTDRLADQGWTGSLESFTSDLPLPMRLLSPAALTISAQGAALGPASLAVAGGRVDDMEFSNLGGRLRTRGRFADVRLDPRRYSADDPMAAIGGNAADPLVVAGAWRLELDTLANGEWTLMRTGGDLRPPGSRLGIGLRELRIDGKVRANQLTAKLLVEGERSGHIDAALSASMEPTEAGGWRLAQRKPWEGTVTANVPDVAWLGPLLSDATTASLRIGGRFDADLKLAGTPAATRASGTLNGSGLTAGWVEQGVRFNDGTLQAHMEDDTLVIDGLRFAGGTRTQPADAATRRSAAGIEPGFVMATAKIKLPDLTGVVQVNAQRAAVVQRADRWLLLTGGGNITISPQRTFVQMTVHTEAGFIDFSQPDLPRLSQDVVVRRGGFAATSPVSPPGSASLVPASNGGRDGQVASNSAAASANGPGVAATSANGNGVGVGDGTGGGSGGGGPAAGVTVPGASGNGNARRAPLEDPRAALGFDVSINLGPAFRLRGNGLDSRIEGLVRLRSEGRFAIRATGTVEAKDGVYEGFGQKLPITRGRVNFQGSLDNPSLDILALRNDLPPEAGEIGVSVTRNAVDPLIRLHSDPALPDVEALSWLVLGRPAERAGGDNVALARAAAGLFSGSGEGLQTRLTRQLGIDEFSLRTGTAGSSDSRLPRAAVAGNLRGDITATTANNQFLTVGKRLSDALTLTYEQAVSGSGTVVQLSYRLSRRFNLIARAGTENALDLVYSLSFD